MFLPTQTYLLPTSPLHYNQTKLRPPIEHIFLINRLNFTSSCKVCNKKVFSFHSFIHRKIHVYLTPILNCNLYTPLAALPSPLSQKLLDLFVKQNYMRSHENRQKLFTFRVILYRDKSIQNVIPQYVIIYVEFYLNPFSSYNVMNFQ